MPWGNNDNVNTPDNFGNGESYGRATHGADLNDDPVTFAFDKVGSTYIAAGHLENSDDFWMGRSDGIKGHDYYKSDGSTDFKDNHSGDRGQYP